MTTPSHALSSILLGGGCFWCVEAVFSGLRGIISAEPGYAGGSTPNPSYEDVCTGRTGHAEVVKVVFDPVEIGLDDVLRVFFTTHDPTQLNRQGNDIGTQYRSVIFGAEEEQQTALKVRDELIAEGLWSEPVVTLIEGPVQFWPAEEKHHDYFARNPQTAYCSAVVAPKVAKARKLYRDRLKQPDQM
ncbi:peptide-methionine (S)-S-oxide reductase MsrA [Gluconobacter kanchanaburiensis]|uniref:Peptide methionine sulfoxide reductase MsrA n=1 Tax=Gluconobacter kanchanaburiensis NBRC 103587 TaxID=1307948 RepID=A0A511B8D9_9PROT|nr:peptide-methionine (S)-S-oxide reductase MsrA [Gluconobacter kanchanaburiensis]MBF0861236.1 peptide-methionine (S)-S-oxide reductase MsrA [Gluconobacter kanchanaburiensis]GBR70916.1 methionine sulfoxide reductase A [Gluconobacter kanchanaburiensis NBRC 103587]GEK95943.1 peptide methionine sulfoxide reductase MsrA [Gluconobacter kanchanaburiensis NBRC 103587]